jgi:hypothetical protein
MLLTDITIDISNSATNLSFSLIFFLFVGAKAKEKTETKKNYAKV